MAVRLTAFGRFDFDEDLTILLGPEEKRITLAKNVACETSRFFKAACNGSWKESEENMVRLPETDMDTFRTYKGWLYTGELDIRKSPDSPLQGYAESLSKENSIPAFTDLINAYVLGEFLEDAKFRNVAVDQAIKVKTEVGWGPSVGNVCDLFQRASHDCKLNNFFVDCWATCSIADGRLQDLAREFPTEFWVRMAIRSHEDMFMTFAARRPEKRGRCHYHDHLGEEDKCI
jgi:hypothetical protein